MNKRPTVKLGNVAEFIRGVTYKPGDVLDAHASGAIACMRTKNVQEDLEDDDLVFIPRLPIKQDRLLREGDILVSTANSWNLVGKCSWVPSLDYEATFGGFTSVLRADVDKVVPRYLYRWFSTDQTQRLVRSLGRQTTSISNLDQARCLELEVPFPSPDEQQRIAMILDKADALRRKRKCAIALLDTLTQSIFLEMFGDMVTDGGGYPLVPFSELVTSQKIGVVRSASELRADAPIPYLRMDSITLDSQLVLEDLRRTEATDAELKDYELRPGDFLFNTRNSRELVGKTAVFGGPSGCIYNNNILRVRFNEKLLADYAVAYFRTPFAKRELEARKSGTTSVFAIYQKSLGTLPVAVPPIEMQLRFAERIKRVRAISRRGNRQNEPLNSLLLSLQHRAFSGRLQAATDV